MHLAANNGVRPLMLNLGIYYSVILCAAGGFSAHIEAQTDKSNPENSAMQAIASTPSALLTPPPLPPPPTPATPAQATSPLQPASPVQQAPPQPPARFAVAGNTYSRGYCTWYAKNKRPDLPNSLGNAYSWLARAKAQGIPTGSVPRVGAIGQRAMHVVYVERVNADGTVFVSEMNYRGWNIVSTRTAPASSFQYIY